MAEKGRVVEAAEVGLSGSSTHASVKCEMQCQHIKEGHIPMQMLQQMYQH